jgi:hypothetical protein
MAAATAAVPLLTYQAHAHHRPGHPRPRHCLLIGTAVLTDRGLVAVEQLRIGDRVLTETGAFRPVRGIGRSAFAREPEERWDESIAPVRIAQSAIGPGIPARDLYLSPEHAVFLDGFLIPVKYLINGVTITQDVTARDVVEYFHIEFDAHEVFYAEGAAVESLRVIDVGQLVGEFAQYQREGSGGGSMAPYAPVLGYNGGRQEVLALARLAVYPWIDVRDHIQIVADRLAARAKLMQETGVTALAA